MGRAGEDVGGGRANRLGLAEGRQNGKTLTRERRVDLAEQVDRHFLLSGLDIALGEDWPDRRHVGSVTPATFSSTGLLSDSGPYLLFLSDSR